MNKLYHADCFDIFQQIEDESIDLVLCDPPYGTTACKWDSVIDLDTLWKELLRIVKSKTAIVIFSAQPFTSKLVSSNYEIFKYSLVWDKIIPGGMSYCRFQPMRQHEDINVFCKTSTYYYPQKIKRDKPIKEGGKLKSIVAPIANFNSMGGKIYDEKNPISILSYQKIRQGSLHPTQKPVALLEYLIKTYSLEGQTVLDFTMGSGSTGVACKNLNRNFIGIEKDQTYFEIAKKRIEETEELELEKVLSVEEMFGINE